MKIKYLYQIIALLLMSPVYAQQGNNDTGNNELIVSATRTGNEKSNSPQVIQIIGEKTLDQQREITSDTSQILSNLLPAFSPSRQKMSGSGETLRGRTPLVMIDGIPQSNPLRPTGREMHTIDASMIERIEVIHGANASNGIGATGGIINIITKRVKPGAFNQHVSLNITSPTEQLKSGTMSYKTNYSLDGNKDYIDYLFAISYENQGLFNDARNNPIGVDNTQGDLMNSHSWDVMGKAGFWLDNNQRIQISINRYKIKNKNNYISVKGDRNNGIPTTSQYGQPVGLAPHNSVWTLGTTYNNHNLAGMKLAVLAYYQRYEALFGATNSKTFQDPKIAPRGKLYDQSRAYTEKYGTTFSLTKDDIWEDRIKATIGIDTLFDNSNQDLQTTGRTYVPKTNYTDLSAFLQLEFSPIEAVKLSAGTRYEYARLHIDRYQTVAANNSVIVAGGSPGFTQPLYNAGIIWTLVKPLSLFGSYSEGFTVPDIGRVLRGINKTGISLNDYSDLQPIVTRNYEAGLRTQYASFNLDASYYKSTAQLGSRVELVNDAFVAKRERTEIDGVEITAGYMINQDHKMNLAWSHMRGRYDRAHNGSLNARLDGLNIAPDRVIFSWAANWTPEITSFLQADWALDKKFDDVKKNFSGYLLVDAAIGYKLPYGKINAGIANLLNKQYITYYSQSALVNDERYFAGRGRTVTLGYRLDF